MVCRNDVTTFGTFRPAYCMHVFREYDMWFDKEEEEEEED